jgi:hypothetical protein
MKADAAVLGFDMGGTSMCIALANDKRITATEATHWPSGLSGVEEVIFIADFATELACK